jgi:hypothetical protein
MEDTTVVDLTDATPTPTATNDRKAKAKAPKKELTEEERAARTKKRDAHRHAAKDKKSSAKDQAEIIFALQGNSNTEIFTTKLSCRPLSYSRALFFLIRGGACRRFLLNELGHIRGCKTAPAATIAYIARWSAMPHPTVCTRACHGCAGLDRRRWRSRSCSQATRCPDTSQTYL